VGLTCVTDVWTSVAYKKFSKITMDLRELFLSHFLLNRIVRSLPTSLWHMLNTAELKELNIYIGQRYLSFRVMITHLKIADQNISHS
jgi:hypothetical protein